MYWEGTKECNKGHKANSKNRHKKQKGTTKTMRSQKTVSNCSANQQFILIMKEDVLYTVVHQECNKGHNAN